MTANDYAVVLYDCFVRFVALADVTLDQSSARALCTRLETLREPGNDTVVSAAIAYVRRAHNLED